MRRLQNLGGLGLRDAELRRAMDAVQREFDNVYKNAGAQVVSTSVSAPSTGTDNTAAVNALAASVSQLSQQIVELATSLAAQIAGLPKYYEVHGKPPDTFGNNGDTAWDLDGGHKYHKEDGRWRRALS